MDTLKQALTGAQMLFVAFGALVLVPLLTGLDPSVALFTAGVGTLIFQWVTQWRVPIFLGSSFAFIPAIAFGVRTWGIPDTLGGLAIAGTVYVVFAGLIRWRGEALLHRLFPAEVTGPVIMSIGLVLAPVAINMAFGRTGDGAKELVPTGTALVLAFISLAATVTASLFGKGMLRLVPVLAGVASGYVAALFLGIVSFDAVSAAPWIGIPSFSFPRWNPEAILFILPFALAPAIEHVGDVFAIGAVTGKDYVRNPGLHRTMLGDGLATFLAGCFGGPPLTTYSEVTGAVALTRAFDPKIMTWASGTAISLAFFGKIGALLQTIPTPVLGGIMALLFGNITVVGLGLLVRLGDKVLLPRNLVLIGLMLSCGLGSAFLSLDGFHFRGVGLAALLGIVLNQILPGRPSSRSGSRSR